MSPGNLEYLCTSSGELTAPSGNQRESSSLTRSLIQSLTEGSRDLSKRFAGEGESRRSGKKLLEECYSLK